MWKYFSGNFPSYSNEHTSNDTHTHVLQKIISLFIEGLQPQCANLFTIYSKSLCAKIYFYFYGPLITRNKSVSVKIKYK